MTTPPSSTLCGTKQHIPLTLTPEGYEIALFYSRFSSSVSLSHIHANRSVFVVVVVVVIITTTTTITTITTIVLIIVAFVILVTYCILFHINTSLGFH